MWLQLVVFKGEQPHRRNKTMENKKYVIKITWSDGSVSYMKQGGIVVIGKENATIYSYKVAKMIVARSSRSCFGERYDIEEVL